MTITLNRRYVLASVLLLVVAWGGYRLGRHAYVDHVNAHALVGWAIPTDALLNKLLLVPSIDAALRAQYPADKAVLSRLDAAKKAQAK